MIYHKIDTLTLHLVTSLGQSVFRKLVYMKEQETAEYFSAK